nr:SIR2 family protein [Candidatus Sigynarchaeota archaeon]
MNENEDGINIEEILSNKRELSFLVGSGISQTKPTGLPTGREFSNTLIPLLFPDEEIQSAGGPVEFVKKYKIRFEEVLSLYHALLDPGLSILDIFIIDREPNLIHDYLALSMAQNCPVFTTNFDCFIERAVKKQVFSDQLGVAIREQDFRARKNEDRTLFKLHGSARDETRDTVITTMEHIGRIQGHAGLLGIESEKEDAFTARTKGKMLVVLGYSASDDFDVVPMLQRITDVVSIIWVEHTPGVTPPIVTREGVIPKLHNLPQNVKTYLITCDTSMLVERVMGTAIPTTPDPVGLQDWISQKGFRAVTDWKKNYAAAEFFVNRSEIPIAIQCLERAMNFGDADVGKCANLMGTALDEKYEDEAIKFYEKAEKDLHDRMANFPVGSPERLNVMKNLDIVTLNSVMCGVNRYPFSTVVDPGTQNVIDQKITTINIVIGNLKKLYNFGDESTLQAIMRGLVAQAHLFRMRERAAEAIPLLQESFEMAKKGNSLDDQVNALTHIVDASIAAKQPITIIPELERCALTLKNRGRRADESMVLFNLGKAFRASNDLRASINHFKKALKLSCEIPDKIGILHGSCELVKTMIAARMEADIGWHMYYLVTSTPRDEASFHYIVSLMKLLLNHHETFSRGDLTLDCIDEFQEIVSNLPKGSIKDWLNKKKEEFAKKVIQS